MVEIKPQLEAAPGKSIAQIRPKNFNDFSQNHCAHFVSHVAGLEFSFNWVQFNRGKHQSGIVDVHQVFARCPKVGKYEDADTTKKQLVFVTREGNAISMKCGF